MNLLRRPNHFVDYHTDAEDTQFWTQLLREIRAFGPDLIILDPVAELFWGNENDRGQVSDFVRRFGTSVAMKTGAAVLLLAHPSKTGKETGTSGSTAWSNAVRSRLNLHLPKDEAEDQSYRQLTVEKSNFAPRKQTISLVWREGVFLPETPDTHRDRTEEDLLRFVAAISKDFEKGEYWSPHHQANRRYVVTALAERMEINAVRLRLVLDKALERRMLVELTVDAHTRTKALATPDQADAYQAKKAHSRKQRKKRLTR